MNAFLIGLQFLTRISLVRQTIWTEEDFGRSVRYFPLVGAVLGLSYMLGTLMLPTLFLLTVDEINFATLMAAFKQHPMLQAAVVFLLTVALTGAIHCDGFMDTFDGLFSGRDRDRMLEIMKDSRVGAFGVVSFVTLSIVEFATLEELACLPLENFLAAVFVMPIVGRLMMVMVIGLFPYARPEGMGKAFAERTDGRTMAFATVETMILLMPLTMISGEIFLTALMSGLMALMVAMYFGRYATKKLGGVTGDIYGAVTLLSELTVLTVFLIMRG